jgi:bacillolysin
MPTQPSAPLETFSFHAAEGPQSPGREVTVRGLRPELASSLEEFNSDEAAARFHLSNLLEPETKQPAFRSVVAPDRPELVPNLRLVDTQELPQTKTRLVRFEQTHGQIPIFGSQAVIELDDQRNYVSAQGAVGKVEGVSPIATISAADALDAIAKFTGSDRSKLDDVVPPELNFFRQPESGEWHLVYYFKRVPAAPAELIEESHGHGLGRSRRLLDPRVDYLVDAHEASVVYYFSSTPLLTPAIPTQCKGMDEEGQVRTFFGGQVAGQFEMRDPFRNIQTHDLALGDLDQAFTPQGTVDVTALGDPIRRSSADFEDTAKAGVSAHVNATKVYDFYKSVLQRDGIDNKGMTLTNVVNCTYPPDEPPPNWHNAVWDHDRMWYGQAPGAGGQLVSLSRLLDVIGHELTHGVTEYSSNLVYRDQSGALNESFSDIFGIIIRNWDPSSEVGGTTATWDWEIGSGVGQNGGPLRDMSDPSKTGDPAHMDDYLHTAADSGGVHTNSNIHNKAAHNLLTASDAAGPIFTPRDVAYLYYLTLVRLTRLATFSDVRTTLINVASTMYAGDQDELTRKLAGIRQAYDAVGIT